jgi:hypothetical protein
MYYISAIYGYVIFAAAAALVVVVVVVIKVNLFLCFN